MLRGYLHHAWIGVRHWLDLDAHGILFTEGVAELDHDLSGRGEEPSQSADVGLAVPAPHSADAVRAFASALLERPADAPGPALFSTTTPSVADGLFAEWTKEGGDRAVIERELRGVVGSELAARLDERSLWSALVDGLRWTRASATEAELRQEIAERVAKHVDGTGDERGAMMADRLLAALFEKGVHPVAGLRAVTRSDIDAVLAMPIAELQAWHEGRRREHLAAVGRAAAGHPLGVHRALDEVGQEGEDAAVAELLDTGARDAAASPSLARIVDAAAEVVPFDDRRRDRELETLERLCAHADSVRVLVVTGAAGSGKTRLMVEWTARCREMSAPSLAWHAGFLKPGVDAAGLDTLFKTKRPTLIVVDDAPLRRADVLALLTRAASSNDRPSTGAPLRIVLVERNAGTNWEAVKRETGLAAPGAVHASEMPLRPFAARPAERRRRFESALPHVRGALESRGHAVQEAPAAPPLDDVAYKRPLFLHLAALAQLMGEEPAKPEALVDWILRREEACWRTEAEGFGWTAETRPEATSWFASALAGVALLGTRSAPDALREIVARATGLAPDAEDVGRLTEALGRLYDGRGLPRTLAEALTSKAVRADGALLDRCLAGASEEEVVDALIVLARDAERQHDDVILRHALAEADADRILAALSAARTGDVSVPLERVLCALVEERPEIVDVICDALPKDSASLTKLAIAALTRRIDRGDATGSELASLEARLAVHLWHDKQGDRSLELTERAVGRLTAAGESVENGFELGVMLAAHCSELHAASRSKEARPFGERAVELLEAEVKKGTADAKHELAKACSAVGTCFSGEEASSEAARRFLERSIEVRRELVAGEGEPRAARELAQSLNSYAHHLRPQEAAIAVAQEAVSLAAGLAEADPGAFRQYKAQYLNTESVCCRVFAGNSKDRAPHLERALQAADESVAIRRELVAADESHRPYLAQSLNNLGRAKMALGDLDGALQVHQQALDIWKGKGAENDPEHARRLSDAHAQIASCKRKQGDFADALRHLDRAIGTAARQKGGGGAQRSRVGRLKSERWKLKQRMERDAWEAAERACPVGSTVRGRVRNLTDYGAFVEVHGVDGLLHKTDMSWTKRVTHPSHVVQKGQEVEVKVLRLDKENMRISLGLKQLTEDPWEREIPRRFRVGAEVDGVVLRRTEDAVVEACDGTRTESKEAARTLKCQRWKVEWREGGTVWGHVSAKSYDAVIAERERQLGFARQHARFFDEPFDERYADASEPICDTCAPDKPVGRWGSGQKFGDSRARAAIEAAETDLGAFDKAMAEHLPRLKDVARLSRETGVDKAAREHAKQMRLGMLGLAKARLALDNAMVLSSEKAAKDVQRSITERTKGLAASYADLVTAVGKEVGKAHGGKYLEDNTQGPTRPYLFVEFEGSKVTGTYIVGGARSTWFTGEVAIDGGITGRSLVAPENGKLTCAEHSEECGFVYVPAVLRFSERKDPDQKSHEAAELWFQQSKWVLAKPFSR